MGADGRETAAYPPGYSGDCLDAGRGIGAMTNGSRYDLAYVVMIRGSHFALENVDCACDLAFRELD